MATYRFANWSGDITGTVPSVSFVMPVGDVNIVGNYSLATSLLRINTAPIGVQVQVKVGANAPVTVNSGQSLEIPEGETVVITAPSEVTA